MKENKVIFTLWTLAGVLCVVIALVWLGPTNPLMMVDGNYGISVGILLIVILFIVGGDRNG